MTSRLDNILYNIRKDLDGLETNPRTLLDCIRKRVEFSEMVYETNAEKQRRYLLTRDIDKIVRALKNRSI